MWTFHLYLCQNYDHFHPNDYISNLSCLPPFHSDMIEIIKAINNCLYFSLARAPNVVTNLGLSREKHHYIISVTTPSWLHTQRPTSNSKKHSTLQHFNTALTQLLEFTSDTKFASITYSQHFNHAVSTYHPNAQLNQDDSILQSHRLNVNPVHTLRSISTMHNFTNSTRGLT